MIRLKKISSSIFAFMVCIFYTMSVQSAILPNEKKLNFLQRSLDSLISERNKYHKENPSNALNGQEYQKMRTDNIHFLNTHIDSVTKKIKDEKTTISSSEEKLENLQEERESLIQKKDSYLKKNPSNALNGQEYQKMRAYSIHRLNTHIDSVTQEIKDEETIIASKAITQNNLSRAEEKPTTTPESIDDTKILSKKGLTASVGAATLPADQANLLGYLQAAPTDQQNVTTQLLITSHNNPTIENEHSIDADFAKLPIKTTDFADNTYSDDMMKNNFMGADTKSLNHPTFDSAVILLANQVRQAQQLLGYHQAAEKKAAGMACWDRISQGLQITTRSPQKLFSRYAPKTPATLAVCVLGCGAYYCGAYYYYNHGQSNDTLDKKEEIIVSPEKPSDAYDNDNGAGQKNNGGHQTTETTKQVGESHPPKNTTIPAIDEATPPTAAITNNNNNYSLLLGSSAAIIALATIGVVSYKAYMQRAESIITKQINDIITTTKANNDQTAMLKSLKPIFEKCSTKQKVKFVALIIEELSLTSATIDELKKLI